jgi:hypothetical protein
MRAGAVENADKALDAVMAQVQVLKEVSNLAKETAGGKPI